jgi:hypothetical protein
VNARFEGIVRDEAHPVIQDLIVSKDVRKISVLSRFGHAHAKQRLQAPASGGDEVRT